MALTPVQRLASTVDVERDTGAARTEPAAAKPPLENGKKLRLFKLGCTDRVQITIQVN
jgi:hypothetical protein